jgi:hypothetical protein
MTEDSEIKNRNNKLFDFDELGSFSKLPDSMLKDLGVVKTAIWGLLKSRSNNYGYSFISQNNISKMFKIGRNTISKNIQELIDVKLLLIKPWPNPIPKHLIQVDRKIILYVPNIIKYQEMYSLDNNENKERISYEERLKMLMELTKNDLYE